MSRPQSNNQYLYLDVGNYNTIPLSEILEKAIDHFGPCDYVDLEISPEWTKVDGCSCCYDYSDYENYICVSLVSK